MSSWRARSRLPWDFRTRHLRRRVTPPYRGYSYGRYRPTYSARDSLYRYPWTRPETTWRRTEINRDVEDVPDVSERELATKLHVTSVDMNVADNSTAHHTDMYECTDEDRTDEYGKPKPADLVVRRGQSFKLTITFDRPYDVKKNDVTLVFSLGDESEGAEKISETVKVQEDKSAASVSKAKWSAVMESKEDKSLKVSVHIPASAPVGEWDFSVRTIVDVQDGKDLIWQYNHNNEIIILFNPWCKEDWVYLDDKEWLEEAVLNDSGALYFGNFRRIGTLAWYFGQFEEGVLDAALHLLRKAFGFEATKAMGKVPRVVRALSKIVNANDDAGVLIGRWSGDYLGGTAPTEWRGSAKILKEYMSTAEPVRFGQCWVFSGVLTTVCRSLGIPCRSVTNFESAHNSDKDHLSCDVVNKKMPNGTWIEDKIDSVWNFHVWNEAWMCRPDLSVDGDIYNGWQAIDATPQERSDGVFQCGPTPVTAVKEGDLHLGSDTDFVFAEVNGDKVEWKEDPKTGRLVQLKRVTNAIGKRISTKKPKSKLMRLDLTDQYKYPEGSEKERAIVRKAERMFRHANLDEDEEAPPPVEAVEVEIQDLDKEILVGGGFGVKVAVRNTGDVVCNTNLFLEIVYTNYRGVVTAPLDTERIDFFDLKPSETLTFSIDVDEEESISRPDDGFNFEVKATAEVKESETVLKDSATLRLETRDLEIEGPEKGSVGETIEIKVSYTNPLGRRLTHCKLKLDSNMKPVDPPRDEIYIRDILAGETWWTMLKLKPTRRLSILREQRVAISLLTEQLGTINGIYTLIAA